MGGKGHFKVTEIPTNTFFPLEMKKWPEITMVSVRMPDSVFDSKTFFIIKKRDNMFQVQYSNSIL